MLQAVIQTRRANNSVDYHDSMLGIYVSFISEKNRGVTGNTPLNCQL